MIVHFPTKRLPSPIGTPEVETVIGKATLIAGKNGLGAVADAIHVQLSQ